MSLKGAINYVNGQLLVEPVRTGWRIVYPDGSPFDCQVYARAQDARRAITMLKR